MHILVTDRLACSRCGPGFGLVLLADRLENRRVLAGHLGCPNCREQYPIVDGFGDLRPLNARSSDADHDASLSPEDPEEALRLGALLGVDGASGVVLLVGPAAGHAPRLASMMPDVEVVAAHPHLRSSAEQEGVTRIGLADRLPFANASLRGAVLQGQAVRELASDAVRALVPGGRLVLLGPVDDATEALAEAGAKILMRADRALVATP